MSMVFRLTCGECDEPVTYSDKNKRYEHANRGVKFLHDVDDVLSERVE